MPSNLLSGQDSDLGELLSVQVLFRHGARTPIWQFPHSHYANFDYPEGKGNLTAAGKAQMCQLGELLRDRYATYLDGLLARNIHAHSSPSRRCLESALSVLGGLVPPVDPGQVWSDRHSVARHWQPIAVVSTDAMLGPEPCAEAKQMERDGTLAPNAPMQRFREKHRDFLHRFATHTGVNTDQTWYAPMGVADSMVCERHYFGDRYRDPEWVAQVGPDTWPRLMAFRNMIFARTFHLPQQYFRLRVGPVLSEIVANFKRTALVCAENRRADDHSNRQLFLYSTHDSLLAPILHSFDLYTDQPGFGSALLFELRRCPETGSPRVHLFYADGNREFEITPLPVHRSRTFNPETTDLELDHCSLDHFNKSLNGYLIEPKESDEGKTYKNPFV